MALQIDVMDETGKLSEEELKLVESILTYASEQEKVENEAEVSVTFVSDKEIQEINKEYRGKDQPTDVISFALEEEGDGEIPVTGVGLPRVLGDIIISLDRAKEQAKDYGHSLQREIGFLTVHGFLHLLGYDHMNENDEKKMFSRQNDILAGYGLER
ncbi:rRNA maturation RNase YbeY [Bacillus niameyensis]|uniref:rRNA maturation RNase YbeY n=1 Tax=Bacillus niameyensis TaxID=1522308 RepID=UPI000783F26E|nr:rRNA maturation RNase YbeY [Bacillus niameyensis]